MDACDFVRLSGELLFQDIGTYRYLTNGMVPLSGVDDAQELNDSMVSGDVWT